MLLFFCHVAVLKYYVSILYSKLTSLFPLVVIDPVAQEFLITPRYRLEEEDPKDLEISYDTDSDKELSISSGGSPSSSTTDVPSLALDSVTPIKEMNTNTSTPCEPSKCYNLNILVFFDWSINFYLFQECRS